MTGGWLRPVSALVTVGAGAAWAALMLVVLSPLAGLLLRPPPREVDAFDTPDGSSRGPSADSSL